MQFTFFCFPLFWPWCIYTSLNARTGRPCSRDSDKDRETETDRPGWRWSDFLSSPSLSTTEVLAGREVNGISLAGLMDTDRDSFGTGVDLFVLGSDLTGLDDLALPRRLWTEAIGRDNSAFTDSLAAARQHHQQQQPSAKAQTQTKVAGYISDQMSK